MGAPIFTERVPEPPEGEHCTFINPLCPNDFCLLQYRHHGGHLLGTMPWDTPPVQRVKRRPGDCAPNGTPFEEIAAEAWIRGKKQWPDSYHGRAPKRPGWAKK